MPLIMMGSREPDVEEQFILRLPPEHALRLRDMLRKNTLQEQLRLSFDGMCCPTC